eukprot:TRINITY_DN3187_c0_g1_i3.p1 TRINITY_DN3187_c0_g1~~TRINITY_DN3187_c0_g1_i3.p1  ORF type:complete len:176 (-),score=54.49 TRINITY_DN3187_c0_g1_i3:34-561(-)
MASVSRGTESLTGERFQFCSGIEFLCSLNSTPQGEGNRCVFEFKSRKMIIKVDGACRNNGKEEAIASIGVYFGEGDAQNISNVFRDVEPTNQKAELVAGIRALETVYVKVATTKPKWNEEEEIVIQSDSEYLVKGMNEWIVNWKKNSFKKSNGKPVANKGEVRDQSFSTLMVGQK